jgi:hypothetical protein
MAMAGRLADRFLVATTIAMMLGGALAAVTSSAVAAPATRKVQASGSKAGNASAASKAGVHPPGGADKAATAEYNGAPVLDASRFFGMAAVGYASAKQIPEVVSKLFCYCGCDSTDNHNRLIDCFTSMHGQDCHICQEEAVLALKLHRQGVPVAEIQKQIDEGFAHHYPFQEKTANYKKYEAARLYKPEPASATAVQTEPSGPTPLKNDESEAPKSATAPKLKPGAHVGHCCGEHDEHDQKKDQ